MDHLMNCAGWLAFSQSPRLLRGSKIADVHVSAKTVNPFIRTGPVRGGRYEVKNATMVDLIRNRLWLRSDKVLGGPELAGDGSVRLLAKVPADTSPGSAEADASVAAGGPLQAGGPQRYQAAAHLLR